MTAVTRKQPDRHPLLTGYFPSIDGLRTIAFGGVFLGHIILSRFTWWGWTGVDLFFVISGFLITGILYDTIGTQRYFRNFYIRRTLRIFPLFYTVWALLLLASLVFRVNWTRYHLFDALYMMNIFLPDSALHHGSAVMLIRYHIPGHKDFVIDIAHFWSLCLEEQFYLIWPLVVWLVRRRIALMYLCGFAICAVPILRTNIYFHSSAAELVAFRIYASPYTRFDTLLVGAWLALWLRSDSAPSTERLRSVAKSLVAGPLILMVSLHVTIGRRWPMDLAHPFINIMDFSLIAFISAGLVLLCLDPDAWLARRLNRPVLIHLGRISYGLYVIHNLLIWPAGDLRARLAPYHLQFVAIIALFAVTYLLARLSYAFIEKPFLKLKKRFPDGKHQSAAVGLPSIMSLPEAG